jgi:hypothetical protein
MKLNINNLANKNHTFKETIKVGHLGLYDFIECDKCGIILTYWCDLPEVETIWIYLNGLKFLSVGAYKIYKDINLLEKELFTCEENIIKNILE